MRRVGIEYVLVHHEATAAFMAAATAQLTGVPGVCIVTRGPGAMNLYPGVATAYLDRRPIVAISADHPVEDPPRDTHQRLPLVDQYRHVTKWSGRLTAESMAGDMAASWELALTGRPGPVYWAFPAAEVSREVVPAALASAAVAAVQAELAPAIERLAAARRPLLITGIGAARSGLDRELVALAQTLACPAMAAPQVKGWFPEDHPLYAGTFGMYRDEPLHALMEEADLIVAVGLDGVDFFKRWRATALVVSLAEAEADDSTFAPVVAHNGDLPTTLRALRAVARPSAWPPDACGNARRAIAAMIGPGGATAPDGDGARMPPQVAVEELRRALPRQGTLTVDVGSHKIVVVQQWRTPGPNQFICSNGLSPMGTGLPFAIAAALERPGVPVACVLGDGGFLIYAGELETIVRLGLPVVLLLLVDGAMSSIKVKQDRLGYAPTGTAFGTPDYGAVARAFGLSHARVGDRASCRAALARAVVADGPTLVEAWIDPAEYDRTQ